MITKNVIKLISLGAAMLFVCSLAVSADPTEEKQVEIQITSVDADTGEQTRSELPVNHDAGKGERGDGKDLPLPENDDLIIKDNPDRDNLVAPDPGAEGDVFILDSGSGIEEQSEEKDTTASLISFPVFAVCVFLGLLGVVAVYGKRQG